MGDLEALAAKLPLFCGLPSFLEPKSRAAVRERDMYDDDDAEGKSSSGIREALRGLVFVDTPGFLRTAGGRMKEPRPC